MSKVKLKQAVQHHLAGQSLSAKQLDALLALQQGKANSKPLPDKRKQWFMAGIAASVLLLANIVYFNLAQTLPQKIGSEVAKNHVHLKPLEIKTSHIEDIRAFLDKLDFVPVESALLRGTDKVLIVGRYCSIQGVTAAQLRLKDRKTGQIHSLYETVYDKNVFSDLPELKDGDKPVTVYSKGLAVDIWVEKGILFALTRETGK